MKICVVSFHSCPFSLLGGDGTGGMSVYLRELSFLITEKSRVKVDIFTRIQDKNMVGIKAISPQVRIIHLRGGPEQRIDRRKLYGYLPEFADNLEHFMQQEREKHDIVYSHYWLSGLVGIWIKQKFNLPLIHIYHTLAFLKGKLLEEEREHLKRLEAEEDLSFFSDAIISSTHRERRNLIEFYEISPDKVKVVYPGVNKSLFHPLSDQSPDGEARIREDENILLYVGRMEPVKGLITVIEALSVLKKSNSSVFDKLKLVAIGGGEKESDLRQNKEYTRIKHAIKKESLQRKVIFLGSREQGELKKYYTAADALVVPSLYESFGLVIIEALACGTPVLVSRIGDVQTIVKEGKNGFTFPPANPRSLAGSIERFFSRKREFWDREKINQDVIQRFSWERTAEETYFLFNEIMKNKASSTTISPPDGSLRLT